MRKIFLIVVSTCTIDALLAPAASAATSVGSDSRVTRQRYARHDGGTDAAIAICNSTAPADYGNKTVNNEPFGVVNPQDPDLVIAGWNDYCSDWMGLGFSTDGGDTWTNSLVPGYPADTSTEGMASPEFVRTNTGSDPLGAFDTHGRFYYGAISFNGFAGPGTNADVWVARYNVVDPASNSGYPIDYLGTTRVGQGTPAANFQGKFLDKPMLEVDRTGGRFDGNVYMCFTKFPAAGQSEIYFAASSDHGATFTKPVRVSGAAAGQGCDIAIEHDGDVYVSWRDFEGNSPKKNFGVSVVRSSNAGATWSSPKVIVTLRGYNPFDGARDCGDGADACPSGFVFSRVPLEPRLTADPTGELPGVYSVVQAAVPSTIVASTSSYSSVGAPSASGQVGQGGVYIMRSTNDGATWSAPTRVNPSSKGHQFFPDADALAGKLVVIWQDSRVDPAYSVQRPVGNTASATSSGRKVVNTYAAVSSNGTSFGSAIKVSSVANNPQYEMFASANVPFYGDYNWVQLVERTDGSLFGYMTWTDNRDVVEGTDPRETTQDGFDVESGWQQLPDGTFTRQFNLGGYDQNIYGNSIELT